MTQEQMQHLEKAIRTVVFEVVDRHIEPLVATIERLQADMNDLRNREGHMQTGALDDVSIGSDSTEVQ